MASRAETVGLSGGRAEEPALGSSGQALLRGFPGRLWFDVKAEVDPLTASTHLEGTFFLEGRSGCHTSVGLGGHDSLLFLLWNGTVLRPGRRGEEASTRSSLCRRHGHRLSFLAMPTKLGLQCAFSEQKSSEGAINSHCNECKNHTILVHGDISWSNKLVM